MVKINGEELNIAGKTEYIEILDWIIEHKI